VDDKQKLRGTVLSAVKHRDVTEVTSPALIVTTGEFKTQPLEDFHVLFYLRIMSKFATKIR
jgi:hypothetical protein